MILTRRALVGLGIAAAVNAVVVWAGRGLVGAIVTDYVAVLPANPYLHVADGLRLYVLLPMVVVCSLAFVLFPGLLLALAFGRMRRWPETLLVSFALSYAALFIASGAVKVITGGAVRGATFFSIVVGVTVVAWLLLAAGSGRRRVAGRPGGAESPAAGAGEPTGDGRLPWSTATDRRRIAWTIAIPMVFLLAAIPAVFWQDMHDDGFEALEIGRSLTTHLLPRFPTPEGIYASSFGMPSMAVPVHWFVGLFGPIEAAARLPMLLYLPLLFCVLLELAEWQAPRRLTAGEEGLMALGLGTYAVTMSYSAGYDAYFADIAAPAAFETLTALAIFAALYFLWRGATPLFLFFSLMAYFCRPTGFAVLLLAAGATWIVFPGRRRAWLGRLAAAAALCLLAAWLYDNVHVARVLAETGGEVPTQSLAGRLRFLRFGDFSRFAWMAAATGFAPALSLFAVRRQDPYARFLTIIVVAYFAVFYVSAFVALHHFVPAMLLPLAILWRTLPRLEPRGRPGWSLRHAGVAVATLLALWLATPRHLEVNRTLRGLGQTIDFRIGDYEADFASQVAQRDLLFQLFPPDWEVENPAEQLVTGYLSVIYYASRPKLEPATINYVVQPLGDSPPDGFLLAVNEDGVGAYVRSWARWQEDRRADATVAYGSRLFRVPRATLFRHWGEPAGNFTIDVKQLIIDAQSLLGVRLIDG